MRFSYSYGSGSYDDEWSYKTGDTVGICIDFDNSVSFTKNGVSSGLSRYLEPPYHGRKDIWKT